MAAELTAADVEGLMARFTYKPNYTFRVDDLDGEKVIQVDMETFDARGKRGKVAVDAARQVVPEWVLKGGEDAFLKWLHDVVGLVERHEMDEWFQMDGKLVADPHFAPPSQDWVAWWSELGRQVRVCHALGLSTDEDLFAKLKEFAGVRKAVNYAAGYLRQAIHEQGWSWEQVDAIPGLGP
jgi:hypothetical protein